MSLKNDFESENVPMYPCRVLSKEAIDAVSRKYEEEERKGDPEAWSCLDFEQRCKINDWYNSVCGACGKRNAEEKRNEEYASYFALIPFAVKFGYASDATLSWRFWALFALSYIILAVVFFVFNAAYRHFIDTRTKPEGKWKIAKRIAQIVLMCAAAFAATLFVLYKVR